jgi:hypothetical protein
MIDFFGVLITNVIQRTVPGENHSETPEIAGAKELYLFNGGHNKHTPETPQGQRILHSIGSAPNSNHRGKVVNAFPVNFSVPACVNPYLTIIPGFGNTKQTERKLIK